MDDATTATTTTNSNNANANPKQPPRRMDSSTVGGEHVKGIHAGIIRASSSRQKVEELASNTGVWFPWNQAYKLWWGFTVFCTFFTAFYETYQIAFGPGGEARGGGAVIGYLLVGVFLIDMAVNFNLAFYDENDEIVWDRKRIAQNYVRGGMFWIDLLGSFPFYVLALAITGQTGTDDSYTQYLALFRLLRLFRLYRVKQLYDILQYSTKISFMTLTLGRDFAVIMVWTHLHACIFYFISRQHNFDPDITWVGGLVAESNGMERYTVSLYWSITTFTTVGYGDFSPVNEIEQVFGIIYMLLNIILQAWVIGSITLLIVKQDEATGSYRDTLERLDDYSTAHGLEQSFYKRLKTQVKLDFNNREISDEQVLQEFPVSVRRKVLRKLYLPNLLQTSLMQGVRQQFVDAFLSASQVEFFSPGEEIIGKGTIAGDLYLLVGGVVQLVTRDKMVKDPAAASGSASDDGWESVLSDSIAGSSTHAAIGKHMQAGEFINPIGFFTESPQMATARTLTVCKTLTLPRAAYQLMADDHPIGAQQVLENLLRKVRAMRGSDKSDDKSDGLGDAPLSSQPSMDDLGDDATKSVRFEGQHISSDYGEGAGVRAQQAFQLQAAETVVEDLVQMHANKLRDDRTTRFLFAAGRGNVGILTLLLNQGLDPDAADYDKRTALMVAAMKGQTDVVTKLLELHADPNLVDMHGVSALGEAAMNGHEDTVKVLLKHGGSLCLTEAKAASTLCQAVFDGDVRLLQRLFEAKIDVNAGDYDRRTAVHIAAAEGNLAALRVLVQAGANLNVKDRWNNSVRDEAQSAKSGHVIDYLDSLDSVTK
jgi:CRP-like cAMP-binding protein